MSVDAGLIGRLGSDEGCEILVGGEWATWFTIQDIWEPISNLCSAVAGLDCDSMDEALAFGLRLRKCKGCRIRKKKHKDNHNC